MVLNQTTFCNFSDQSSFLKRFAWLQSIFTLRMFEFQLSYWLLFIALDDDRFKLFSTAEHYDVRGICGSHAKPTGSDGLTYI